MCGVFGVFSQVRSVLDESSFAKAKECFELISHRGPDYSNLIKVSDSTILGHHRLSIIDLTNAANQPITLDGGDSYLAYNGEIYNYKDLAKEYFNGVSIKSDTHLLALLLSTYQVEDFIAKLDGMFAFAFYSSIDESLVIARDRIGIKPMYYAYQDECIIFSSEPGPIAKWTKAEADKQSLEEIKLFRRPTPGSSIYENIYELLPGQLISKHSGYEPSAWKGSKLTPSTEDFNQEKLLSLISTTIREHMVGDVEICSFQSGGIDSSIIAYYSRPSCLYSTGMLEDNEFEACIRIADTSKLPLKIFPVEEKSLKELTHSYLAIKKEPISVPNEVLIYNLCNQMEANQKVYLTGEGADEIFFGYSRIYKWANDYGSIVGSTADFLNEFIGRYRYIKQGEVTCRFMEYIYSIASSVDSAIQFVEDFFLLFHLPGLLARADRSSMAAGKEARVPFCTAGIINYMYRRPYALRSSSSEAKIPLRNILLNTNLAFVTNIPKVGFPVSMTNLSSDQVYAMFNQYSMALK